MEGVINYVIFVLSIVNQSLLNTTNMNNSKRLSEVKVYRNIPVLDISDVDGRGRKVSFLRKMFPFYFRFTRGFSFVYFDFFIPFVGFSGKIAVK